MRKALEIRRASADPGTDCEDGSVACDGAMHEAAWSSVGLPGMPGGGGHGGRYIALSG